MNKSKQTLKQAQLPAKQANTMEFVITLPEGKTSGQVLAELILDPAFNAGSVVHAFETNIVGGDRTPLADLKAAIEAVAAQVKSGDLASIEAMLVSQAMALQTIFASLTRRGLVQPQLKHLDAIMSLGLKAQAQSRATISTLIDLKYPRQTVFAKQANVAGGHQQVNNNANPNSTHAGTHAEKNQTEQSKLLEASHGSTHLDNDTAQTASAGYSTVEAVGQVNRAKNPRGKAHRVTQPR